MHKASYNEFPLQKCRNNMKTKKMIFFFKSEKNVQVQLMSFCHMNAETRIKKMNFSLFPSNPRKFTSPANEPLLHKCRNKNDFFFSKIKIKIYKSSK